MFAAILTGAEGTISRAGLLVPAMVGPTLETDDFFPGSFLGGLSAPKLSRL